MNHVMLDLETLGNKPGCVVASIGAVYFDPLKGERGDTFYRTVDIESGCELGLRIEPGSVLWWMKQSDEARAVFRSEGALHIFKALNEFGSFLKPDVKLWGHGATFDPPVLEAAFKACQIDVPWSYKNVRDTRTIFDAAGPFDFERFGTHHHVLDDAITQADAVCKAYAKLGLKSA